MEKQAYRLHELSASTGVGRSKLFEEIAAGRLRAFKLGRLTLVSKEAARAWLQKYEENTPILRAGGANG